MSKDCSNPKETKSIVNLTDIYNDSYSDKDRINIYTDGSWGKDKVAGVGIVAYQSDEEIGKWDNYYFNVNGSMMAEMCSVLYCAGR